MEHDQRQGVERCCVLAQFLASREREERDSHTMIVVENWFEELKPKVGRRLSKDAFSFYPGNRSGMDR